MNLDPDGEIKLDTFTVDAMKWLHERNITLFQTYSKAVLENANENFKRTGEAFTSFELQRSIIENIQKMQDRERKEVINNVQ